MVFIGCRKTTSEIVEAKKEIVGLCVPITTDRSWYESDNAAPLFEGMGDLHYPISTQVELAQKYFNQGLTLAYGFNHAEAARSFHYASRLDSTCAMAYWGFAYVLGPNYNAGMESDNYARAYSAIEKAKRQLSGNTGITEKEKDLILALSKRYVADPVEDRYSLDLTYAEEMKKLYDIYPSDGVVDTLYAESLMNLHPWDLFDADGLPKAWTPEIIQVLEKILIEHPMHSGAHHLYIHAVEASNNPQKGLASAQLFDNGLVPNSGHLVHMPSHIYIRTGDYHKGTVSNINAIKVDSTYITACHAYGAYPLAYYPHNIHFMAATATLEGNSKWALYAANKVADNANRMLMKEPGWGTIQHYFTIPYYVYVKLGKWDEILAMVNVMQELPYPTAMLHYAKGMALLKKGMPEKAHNQLIALKNFANNDEFKSLTIWDINSVYDLLQIAHRTLEAEILASANDYDKSIILLEEVIEIEDRLNYNEPPDWFFSVRHNLGSIQLQAKQYRKAVETFLADLEELPKNGWALNGLALAYSGLGEVDKAAKIRQQFNEAWKTADIELHGSVVMN